jgi:Flp pilus assembly protein TadG
MQVTKRQRDSRRGNAIVEMAVAVPVLLIMVMGAIDFGRLYFEAVVAQNSAIVGSFYGAQEIRYAADTAGIRAAATGDATDIVDGYAATHEVLCECLNGNGDYDSGVAQASCSDADCGVYGAPRVYVKTHSAKTFSTMGWYPGVPQNTPIGATGWVRVQ